MRPGLCGTGAWQLNSIVDYPGETCDLAREQPERPKRLQAACYCYAEYVGARLGIGVDGDFDFSALPAEIQEALKTGVKEGFAEIETFIAEFSTDPLGSAKVFGTREFLIKSAKENFDLDRPDMLRSAGAHTGLYGNSAAEAIYPTYFVDADGEPLDASKQSYTLSFEKDALPPVKAFWSVTMYDGKTQLFIDNPLDRYLLSSTKWTSTCEVKRRGGVLDLQGVAGQGP